MYVHCNAFFKMRNSKIEKLLESLVMYSRTLETCTPTYEKATFAHGSVMYMQSNFAISLPFTL
jgi:hypothetical protein